MTKEEFNIWAKEHKGNLHKRDFDALGLRYEESTDEGVYGYWYDENGEKVAAFVKEEEPIIYTPDKMDEYIKTFARKFELIEHYTPSLDLKEIMSGKQWYDKFYERKGRKRRWQR